MSALCDFKRLIGKAEIDPMYRGIYHFSNYYSSKQLEWASTKSTDLLMGWEDESNKIYSIKNSNGEQRIPVNFMEDFAEFSHKIIHFLKQLKGDWVLCAVPCSKQVSTEYLNGVQLLLRFTKTSLPDNFSFDKGILLNKAEVAENHSGLTNRRTIEDNLNNLICPFENSVRGKNFIIFDDITTSGASLLAARRKLERLGANKVVLIALAKTYVPKK